MKLCAFLFEQLWNEGVRHVFGIPGDFVLNLYEALEDDGRFQLLRLSHEPAVGFAADGAARIGNGLGVCCVTYGAGGLNMINAVACAYAEESPLVVLSGGPGRHEKRTAVHVHHEVKTFESQLRVYEEVTASAAILEDPRTAASLIRRALDTAVKVKRPVYLEIPRDMVFAEIDVPADLGHVELKVDRGAVDEAAKEIMGRIAAARRPVLIVGVEVHRFGLRERVVRLAERLAIPVASSFLGRGVFPTRHPQFIGTYLGVVSPASLRETVEQSDCLLLLGELVSDTSLGISANCLSRTNLMIAVARDVYIGHHRYHDAPIDQIVDRLVGSVASGFSRTGEVRLKADTTHLPDTDGPPEGGEHTRVKTDLAGASSDDEPITVLRVIDILNDFLASHADTPVVADTGDCLFASVDIRANEIIAPAYYATMGFSIPAALGVQVAGRRRPLVLVGDGAFQMTGSEIAHASEYGCNPVIVVFNNSRWEMLQAFFPDARYNSTVPWPFARLADLWGGRGFDAATPGALREALTAAWSETRFTLIDVRLQPGDISPILRGFVAAFKKQVY